MCVCTEYAEFAGHAGALSTRLPARNTTLAHATGTMTMCNVTLIFCTIVVPLLLISIVGSNLPSTTAEDPNPVSIVILIVTAIFILCWVGSGVYCIAYEPYLRLLARDEDLSMNQLPVDNNIFADN